MKPIQLEQINVRGDLRDRLEASLGRLAEPDYGPDAVFKPATYDWPGDNEGRTLLAQVLTARATGRAPVHLEAIMKALSAKLNNRGYFGRILPRGMIDEQQLSGNSWYLRALVELYLWRREPDVLGMIEQVVRGLVLPSKELFEDYPCDPAERATDGEAAGSLSDHPVRNWYLSTDIGCAFIMLDGATHAYEVLGWPELRDTIDAMITRFLSIDLLHINAQTHATLSALRGILRYYGTSGETALLGSAETVFALYLEAGITENYANRNWFNRPWWTEPCAVVDSFLASVELWRHTGRSDYLDAAHGIYYNGLSHGQRHTGGFGCDNCSGATEPELYALEHIFEAYWCCTMRGGEGLAKAAEYGYWTDAGAIVLPFYHNGSANLAFGEGTIRLKQTTDYPYQGQVLLEVERSEEPKEKTLKFFIPAWASSGAAQVWIDGHRQHFEIEGGFAVVKTEMKAGTRIEFMFELGLRSAPILNGETFPDAVTYSHGPLMLYAEAEPGAALSAPDASLRHEGKAVYLDDAGQARLRAIFTPFRMLDKLESLKKKRILFRAE